MKHQAHAGTLLLALFALAGCFAAAAQEPALLSMPDKAAAPFQLKDPLIEKAVRETLAESKQDGKDGDKARAMFAVKPVLSGDKYEGFGRQFSEAQKPSCMGPDALKHQPAGFTSGGWNFGLGGIFALPFWGAAIVRGKCN